MKHAKLTAPPALTIRPAEWRDKAVLLDMIRTLARHHGDAATITLPVLVDLLKSDLPWLRLIVAERDGMVVGYAGLTGGMRLHFGERVMTLDHLFIDENHRGQGIGRALIAHARQTAVDHGCARLTVGTRESNTHAQAAYLACGFSEVPQTGKRFVMQLA
ncbi:GNAT family N-acetyltransferase [Celeribacter arenosi]|uniref:GNAT family N-acetyltransferase n=1 Tax=Celeribacter arenosi TaxID=792649 RepID=A0ABP7KGQ6_9RHOB